MNDRRHRVQFPTDSDVEFSGAEEPIRATDQARLDRLVEVYKRTIGRYMDDRTRTRHINWFKQGGCVKGDGDSPEEGMGEMDKGEQGREVDEAGTEAHDPNRYFSHRERKAARSRPRASGALQDGELGSGDGSI